MRLEDLDAAELNMYPMIRGDKYGCRMKSNSQSETSG